MKDIEKKVICGVTHVKLPCARCNGWTWISYSKRLGEVRCNDCLPEATKDSIENKGTNGGRLVDRRRGES